MVTTAELMPTSYAIVDQSKQQSRRFIYLLAEIATPSLISG